MTDYKVAVLSQHVWQPPVLDKDLNDPPGGESKGDRYIVGDSAINAWSGEDENIATYNGSGWDFTAVKEGMICYVADENEVYWFIAAWTKVTIDVEVTVISSSRNLAAATGDVAYNGLGFKPRGVIAFAQVDVTVNSSFGMAAEGSTDGSIRMLFTGNWFNGNSLINFQVILGGTQDAVVKTWDVDGFTLTWTKGGSPTGTANLKFFCIG